jgi:flagellar protein FlaG
MTIQQTNPAGVAVPFVTPPGQTSAGARPQGTSAPAATPSPAQVSQAVQEVKDALGQMAQNLQFLIDETTGKTVVKVVDGTTNEVIRQIPSEELLAITRALDKFQGVLLKQKA